MILSTGADERRGLGMKVTFAQSANKRVQQR